MRFGAPISSFTHSRNIMKSLQYNVLESLTASWKKSNAKNSTTSIQCFHSALCAHSIVSHKRCHINVHPHVCALATMATHTHEQWMGSTRRQFDPRKVEQRSAKHAVRLYISRIDNIFYCHFLWLCRAENCVRDNIYTTRTHP